MRSFLRIFSLYLCAVFSLVLSRGIASDPKDCNALLLFASHSVEMSDAVVLTAYEEILKEVGDGKLRPELIQKMIEAQDPYTLPKGASLDSSSLANSLAEFKRLLQEKTGDEAPHKEALLQLLRTKVGKQQVQVKKEAEKATDTAVRKLLEQIKWQDPPREVDYYNGWFIGVADATQNKKGDLVEPQTIYLRHLDGRTLEVPFRSKIDVVVPALNPKNGEIWYSDRGFTKNRPDGINLMRMSIFDEQGNPRKRALVTQFPSSEALDEYSVDGLAFSPSGDHMLIVDDSRGGLLMDFGKGGAPLGKVITGGTKPHFGFIGDHHLFIQKSTSIIEIIDVRYPTHPKRVAVQGYESVNMSPDGKTLFVPFRNSGQKQGAYVWDMASLRANPKLQPTIMDFGHQNPESDWQAAWGDELIPLNSNIAIQIKRKGGKSYYAEEIRVLDVKNPAQPKLIESFPIPPTHNYLNEIKLSPDRKYIFSSEGKDDDTLKTWVWDISRLLDH